MEINEVTLAVNSVVTFQTRSTNDSSQVYVGTLDGVDVTYRVARSFGDLTAYHTTVPTPEGETRPTLESLSFFLLRLPDGTIRPFAAWWIEVGTFEAVETAPDMTIIIRRLPATKVPIIMSWIRGQGYSCSVVASTTPVA